MPEPRVSYTGERVYVGVDMHKETYTVPCVCRQQIVKTRFPRIWGQNFRPLILLTLFEILSGDEAPPQVV